MENRSRDNPYEVLDIKRDASPEEVKRAYRKKSTACHPDLHPGPNAQQEFERVKAAYDTLSDTEKRRRYDQTAGVDLTKGARMAVEDYWKQVFHV